MDATPCVATFDRPAHWDEILAFAKLPGGTGNAEKRIAARPAQGDIDAAFADLLKKIQFANSRVNAGYVQALGMNASGQSPAARLLVVWRVKGQKLHGRAGVSRKMC
jgi:hypothetical protein